MEFVILIENLPAEPLFHEHGLSILFKADGLNYLLDTGASGKFLHNLEQLNVCGAQDIDCVIISHGHNDHTGGLRSFFEVNSTAPVYLHKSIRGSLYFSCRPKTLSKFREFRSIGMEQALFAEQGERFREISQTQQISKNVTIIPAQGDMPHPTPMGNEFLFNGDYPDNFTHEVITLVEEDGNFIILSPCTHNGILNVLERCVEYISGVKNLSKEEAAAKITTFIGGLHYVDYLNLPGNCSQKDESGAIENVAGTIKKEYPKLKIYSGHCTCPSASALLKSTLQERYEVFHTGETIQIFVA